MWGGRVDGLITPPCCRNFVDSGWNPYLVGVGKNLFADSMNCGQCLLVYNPVKRRAVVSVITDYCPPPCSGNQLDIQSTAAAFLAGGSPLNSIPYRGGPENFKSLLAWPVECDWKGQELGYYFDTGSSRFHWYLIMIFEVLPVVEMQVSKLDAQGNIVYTRPALHDKYGRWVVEFSGKGGQGTYR